MATWCRANWPRRAVLAIALATAMLAGPSCQDEDEESSKPSDFYLVSAKEYAEAKACLAQLKSVGKALTMFASTHGGQFPPSLEALVEAGDLRPKMLRCPGPDRTPYVYIAGQDQAMPRGNVLVYESEAIHRGKCNVLRVSGAVEALTPEQFQADLAQTRKHLRE